MVRFKVPIKDIMGLSYYRYEMSSSNYNPTIGSSITISVRVTNVFGNAIDGKSLTLYNNGSSVGTATTNSSGVASWSVTLSDYRNHHFNCNNSVLDLKVIDWEVIEIPNGSNLNNYIDVGMYFQGANVNTTNISNLPNNNHTAFCLLVEYMGGNARKQTLTFQQNDNKTYIRIKKWDNTWTTWTALF